MKPLLLQMIFVISLTFSLFTLGCNTIEGVGDDLEEAGDKIEETTDKAVD